MRTRFCTALLLASAVGAPAACGDAVPRALTGLLDAAPHAYKMTTVLTHIQPNGERGPKDTFTVWLKVVPSERPEGDLVACQRFTFREGGGPERAIPALQGWSYHLTRSPTLQDEKGQLFGIPHAAFESLQDDTGRPLGMNVYFLFNAFVDFHSFCHVLCRRTPVGKGLQDLRQVGDRIVFMASHGEAPIHLGSLVGKGSTFKNGEITLEWKGDSRIGGSPCAIVGYDSGDSTLRMHLQPAPGVAIETVGSSHYFGDLYVDLATQWVRKATLTEIVVSEQTGPALPGKVHTVVERSLVLEEVPAGK